MTSEIQHVAPTKAAAETYARAVVECCTAIAQNVPTLPPFQVVIRELTNAELREHLGDYYREPEHSALVWAVDLRA